MPHAALFNGYPQADWDILENGDIRTVGDLAKLISTDPKEQKTLTKFGKRKLEKLEEQFMQFWERFPEVCGNTETELVGKTNQIPGVHNNGDKPLEY